MGTKRSRCFLCFGGSAVEEDEMEETRRRFGFSGRIDEASPIERSWNRRCSFSRSLSKLLKPLALLASSRRRRKERRDSNRFNQQKDAESSAKSKKSDEDRRPREISTPSSASCSSSSSPSSSYPSSPSSSSMVSASSHLLPSMSGLADAKKLSMVRIAGSKKPLPPAMARTRNCHSVTATFLFLSSLTLMVFYGRLCAILWMSSWFCYVARRSGAAMEKARGSVALRPTAAKAAEIKRRTLEVESCF